MIIVLAGVLMMLWTTTELFEVKEQQVGKIYYAHTAPPIDYNGLTTPLYELEETVVVEPLSSFKFKNVVRQAYDYSCGSAALTSILTYYLGETITEREVMEGLLQYGEAEKIIQRRGFSLLDMKRYVAVLGYKSGGFRATLDDLESLEHPAIVPIHYAGFKHFIVVKAVLDGHVFAVDPALGNISFPIEKFRGIWDGNVLFMVYPNSPDHPDGLALREDEMRIIDDRTFRLVVFQEFPQFTTAREQEIDEITSDGEQFHLRDGFSLGVELDE